MATTLATIWLLALLADDPLIGWKDFSPKDAGFQGSGDTILNSSILGGPGRDDLGLRTTAGVAQSTPSKMALNPRLVPRRQ